MGRSRGSNYELKARFSIEADTRGVDQLEKRLADLERRLNRFGGTKATATISERGADDVDKKLTSTQKKLDGLDGDTATMHIGETGSDEVSKRIDSLERMANKVARGTYDLGFKAETAEAAREINTLGQRADAVTRNARTMIIQARAQGFQAVQAQTATLEREVRQLNQEEAVIRARMQGHQEITNSISSIRRSATELTARPYEVEVHGDVTQAQRAFSQLAAQARAQFARAYVAEVKAETQGFPEAAAQAAQLKREMLTLSQARARVAVELAGVPQAISGLISVKRTAESAQGTYRISIDYSKIAGAISSLVTLRGAATAVGGVLGGLGSHLMNSSNSAAALSRAAFIAGQSIQVFAMALAAVAVVAAGPLVAGLGIAVGALGAMAAGFGLVAAAVAPAISQLSNYTQNQNKADSAQKAATASASGLAQAEAGLAKAQEQVATAARSGEQAISQAVKSHEDAIRGVDQARRQYDQALQGVQDAERQGEEQIASAIQAHTQAVRAVEDAHRAVGKAVQEVSDAEVAAQESVRQAMNAHEDAIKALGYAQQDYELAQQETTDAQKELTMATEDYNDALATEQQRLLSLQYDLEGLGINQRQLALDIEEAARAITEAETSEERARAALRYEELLLRQKEGVLAIEQAQSRLSNAQTEGTDELQSAYDAQQNAIGGVEDALRNEARAADGVTDAQEQVGETALAVNKAQTDGARSVADAQERVADTQRALVEAIENEQIAQANIGKARDEAARGIAEAQQQVLDAQLGIEDAMRREAEARAGIDEARMQADQQMRDALRAVEEAQRRVAEAAAENADAQSKLNEALGALPTAEVEAFRQAAVALWDNWKSQTQLAQSTILQLGTHILTIANGAIPYLAQAANQTALQMVTAFNNIIGAWGNFGVFESFKTILEGIPTVTQLMSQAFGYTFGALINILGLAMPYITQFAQYLSDVSLRFLEWTHSEAGRAAILQFFASAAPVASALWGWIVKIAGALISWSTSNPQAVADIINVVGAAAWGAFSAIGMIVTGLISLNNAVPGLVPLAGAMMGAYFAIRLIPQPLREVVGYLAKYALGMSVAGSTTAGAATAASTAPGIFTRLGAAFTSAGGGMAGLRAAMSMSIPLFAGLTAPVWLIVAAIAALAAGAYLIYQNWGTIGPWFASMWEGIKTAASGVWSYISADIYAAGAAIYTFLVTQWGMISTWWAQMVAGLGFSSNGVWTDIYNTVSWAINGISSIISTISPYIIAGWKLLWDNFVTVVSGVWTMVSSVISGGLQVALGTIMTVFGFWKGVFTGDWELFWNGISWIVSGVWTALSGIIQGALSIISGIVVNGWTYISDMTGITWGGISSTVSGIWNGMWSIASSVFNGIWSAVDAAWNGISSTSSSIWNGIWSVLDGIWNGIWSLGSTVFNGIWSTVDAAWNGLWTTSDTVWNAIWTTLDTIWNGLWTGAETVFNGIWTTIDTVWNGIWTAGETVWNGIWTGLEAIWNGIWTAGETIYNGIWTTIDTVWNGVWTTTDTIWNSIWTFLSDTWSGIYTTISTWLSDTWTYIEDAWNGIWTNTEYVWDSVWTYLGDTWSGIYDTVTGWISDLWTYAEDAWYGMWEGIDAFGGWVYDSLNSWFGDAIKTALDWLSTLLYGAQQVLDAIGDPGGWSASIGEVAAAIDYYAEGGIKYAEDGASSTRFMDRGGIGTDQPHDQHVIWNEQHGNEAWIAERGPRQANLSYLREAASWLGQSVVPTDAHGHPNSEPEHNEPRIQPLPPPMQSLAGGAGTGDKKKMMEHGGVLYAAHGATLPWDSGLTSRTAEIANEIYGKTNAGNLYYNSYYGHPDGYPEREAYSVDWWNGYRGGQVTQSEGDSVVSYAEGYPEFSYWIWNGSDSYDGSIGASDPHYDHAHTTFMGDIGLGGGGGVGSYLRSLAQKLIEQFMPAVPDFGDGMVADAVEGIGEHIRSGAIEWIMSLLPKGSSGPGSTEEVREWVRAGLEYGNVFSASDANVEEMASRAMQESSGDPNAINDYDINAQNGTPSKGLFQIIEPTWESYRSSYGEDTGAFADAWNDPVMSAATASRYMYGRYGEIVGATGIGYSNGGIATGPQLGLMGEGGNEMMIPLDHPNAVRMLSDALNSTDPARNRATQRAASTPETTDNMIVAGAENAMDVGISGDAALIGEKIDRMKEEIKQSMREEFAETELGGSTMEQMIKTAVATALAVVSSKGGQEIIDDALGAKFDFDREMSEL